MLHQHQFVTCVSSGSLSLDMVDEAAVERNLLTGGLPDPDILIRTSGEKRVSKGQAGVIHTTQVCMRGNAKGAPRLKRVDGYDI